MSKSIGIIGGGNMGEALIKGLHKSHRLLISEADSSRARFLKNKYRVALSDIGPLVKDSGIIILAVKPQDMAAALDQMKKDCTWGKLVISIAAGLTTTYFEKYFSSRKIAVVRCMPNMPAMIGEGITALCAGKHASQADLKAAQNILQTLGETLVVKESMMDAVTAVSGSGPAYVFLFVEHWIAAARKLGFNAQQAKQLVYKTLTGSAHQLMKSEFDASELRVKVTSKGGTTQAAMDVFASQKFDRTMKDALKAAQKRAKALAK